MIEKNKRAILKARVKMYKSEVKAFALLKPNETVFENFSNARLFKHKLNEENIKDLFDDSNW